ncbi:MAG: hypothetical protein U1D97_15440 [Desulfuromonadales bacterium]|nr:hypothetical protein [Desulfuromonadales bacterium]
MNNNQDKTPLELEPFAIDHFRPGDAEGIVRLFRAVYGDHYPIRLFYDPDAITRANEEGRYCSIVARTPSGRIVGVNHLYPSAPCRSLYESGVGLVLKEYRSLGINNRALGYLYNEFVPRNPHIEEVFGEAVCNHPYMQKSVMTHHYVETAIEVALMPAEAYTQEKSAAGRVAALVSFRCYRPKPHRIYLPRCYERELRRIYAQLDDAREIVLSQAEIAGDGLSRAEMEVFDFARVARIAVYEIGADLGEYMDELERKAVGRKAVVLQAWLNLAQPLVGEAVEILRDRGYFFGGPLPRWFDSDGFLMQKLLCPPDFEGIVLVSDFAKELLKFIKEDWQARGSGLNS